MILSTGYYLAGSERIAMRVITLWVVDGGSSQLYYLFTDHLGSTSEVRRADGSLHSRQYYRAFGEERLLTPPNPDLPTDRTYTGQRKLDADSGLLHYGARIYDPALGRFAQADSIIPQPGDPTDWDRYSYVRNSPINFNDPTGNAYCPSNANGVACYDDKATFGDSYLNIYLYINAVNRDFGMVLDDVGWSLDQGQAIYNSLYQMKNGIDKLTAGSGKEWILKNLAGTIITMGDLFGSSFVTGSTIHLANNFEKSSWESLNGKYDTMIIHEIGHVVDNRSQTRVGDASIFGGGAGDQLMKHINAKPNAGIRAALGLITEKVLL